MDDALKIKEKIVSIIKERGPLLPVKISNEIHLSLLFTSAFLSELLSEKEIKMSNMRIGSSPLYFVNGQEPLLENFSSYLKGKEKEAFLRLKENKFLIDSEQEPAIRVALRQIKDFAYPFQHGELIVWRYFLIGESEFNQKEEKIKDEIIEEIKEKQSEEDNTIKEEKIEDKDSLILEKNEEKEGKKKTKQKKVGNTKKDDKNNKKDENFFNKIKEFLKKEGVELLDIINFKSDEAFLKVKKNDKEFIVIFLNSKKISEKEIIEINKKAGKMGIKEGNYEIYFFGELSKKTQELINSIKRLEKIGKIE
jgi:hypothetical protein